MTNFINLIVTNGIIAGEEGSVFPRPAMNGDNLINDDHITFVEGVVGAGLNANTFEITTNFLASAGAGGDLAKYTLIVSKANDGAVDGNDLRPSAEWMLNAKKAITSAISNQAPGGTSTTVVLPKDGNDTIYFRSISLT